MQEKHNPKKKKKKKDDEDGENLALGDGTQIRTYINSVLIKIDIQEVIKLDGKDPPKGGKSKMLE